LDVSLHELGNSVTGTPEFISRHSCQATAAVAAADGLLAISRSPAPSTGA
jgi:hypothetical protein